MLILWLLFLYEVRVTELECSCLVAGKVFQSKGEFNYRFFDYFMFRFEECKLGLYNVRGIGETPE